MEARRDALHKRFEAAEKSVSKLGASGEKHWAELKSRVERAMRDLRKAYQDLSPGSRRAKPTYIVADWCQIIINIDTCPPFLGG